MLFRSTFNFETVTGVSFYSGSNLIGKATTAPYNMTWKNVPAGKYSITAVVTDTGGGSAVTPAAGINVIPYSPPVETGSEPGN